MNDIATMAVNVNGHIRIYEPDTGKVLVDKRNAINYENFSIAIADSLANRGFGTISQMAFGNGGSSVDPTGVITYLPPNSTGINASLYNQTYSKIVDSTSVYNFDPANNKILVLHTPGKLYTDIVVQCLLDYGEPAGQTAFDNGTQTESLYTFDELGLVANYGTDENGVPLTRLLTHVIFHPVAKALNRQIQIDYTVRISAVTTQLVC